MKVTVYLKLSHQTWAIFRVKGLCQRSRTEQENLANHKGGKKTEESLFTEKKTRIKVGNRRESIINQQRGMKSKTYKMPLESLPASKLSFTQALPAAEPSQEMRILVFVTVRFLELQDGIILLIYWLSDYVPLS